MKPMLDPRWRLFLLIAETGSLTRAAAALGTQQSVVSRRLTQLERECGARLFQRTGRGVVLSDFGQHLLPRIRRLVEESEALQDDIRSASAVPRGEVRLGLLSFLVPVVAVPLTTLIAAQFPEIQLHFTEGSSAQLQEWLQQGRVDIALHLQHGEPRPDERVVRQLPLALAGPRAAAVLAEPTVALRQLAGLPLILPPAQHPLRLRLVEAAAAQGIVLTVQTVADSVRLQLELAAAGLGFAVVSRLDGSVMPGHIAMSTLVEPELHRTLVLNLAQQRPMTLASRTVQSLLLDLLAPQQTAHTG